MTDTQDLLEQKLHDTLSRFLVGTDENLQRFAREVSRNLLVTAATGTPTELAIARAQVPLLMEQHELTVTSIFADTFYDVVDLLLQVAFSRLALPA